MALGLVSGSDETRRWREVAEMLAGTETHKDLTLNVEGARRQRDDHARRFLEPMFDQMIPSIKPLANASEDKFNIQLSKADLSELRRFLFSEEGREQIVEAWFGREGWGSLTLPPRIRERARTVLDAYYRAYRGYVVNMFERNQQPSANDALDLDLTLVLWRRDWVLVTADRKLLDAMRVGGVRRRNFVDLKSLKHEEK